MRSRRTCVGSEVCFQVRALEVGLLATGEVADVVSPAREVSLRRASALTRGHVDGRRGQGEELGVAQGDHALGARLWLGHGRLRNHEHHRALAHGGAHQNLLWERSGGLGKDRLGTARGGDGGGSLHLNRRLDERRDESCLAVHWKDLAEDRRARHGRWWWWRRQDLGGRDWRWCCDNREALRFLWQSVNHLHRRWSSPGAVLWLGVLLRCHGEDWGDGGSGFPLVVLLLSLALHLHQPHLLLPGSRLCWNDGSEWSVCCVADNTGCHGSAL